MNPRSLASIEVDALGRLWVRPVMDGAPSYEFIYREANGLRWNREEGALCAYEPARWEPVELLRHIVATLGSACDEVLRADEATVWKVPADMKSAMLCVLETGPT